MVIENESGVFEREPIAELERRVKTLGFLGAGVAHDIRAPLSVAIQYLPVLSKLITKHGNEALRSEALPMVIAMNDALRCVAIITEGLQNVLHDDSRVSNIGEVLDTSIGLVADLIRGRAQIAKRVDRNAHVRADPAHLIQIFTKLLQNAAQAIPIGADESNEISVDAWIEDGYVCVSIHDTGVGVPPALRAKIFEPRFTTKSRTGGSEHAGMGLYIARELAEALNGVVSLDDDEASGTTFQVILPAWT